MIVLRDYFELSGQPVHKIVVHDHFLTIPDEFGADSDRIIGGISIGLFFPSIAGYPSQSQPLREIST